MNVEALTCPKCKASDPVVGIEVRGEYEGVLFWECVEDGARFHRFSEDHYLFKKADPYVKRERTI